MHFKYLFNTDRGSKYEVDLHSKDERYFHGKLIDIDTERENEIWLEFDSNEINKYHLNILSDVEIKDFKDILVDKIYKKRHEVNESEREGVNYEDEAEEEDVKYKPYNVELIRVDPKSFTLDTVFNKIEKGNINLSPDFQRNAVWSKRQKCLFIESLLLRIPVPVLYLSQDNDGNYDVVDGLQRLTTIREYMNNEFSLSGLEYLGEQCNGKFYSHEQDLFRNRIERKKEKCLDFKFKTRIEDTQFMCNVIDPQTPSKAKYDIFYRLNTGGSKLNHQEVRNCFARTSTRKLFNNICNDDSFLKATDQSVSRKRMADHELILRFISFYMYYELKIGEEYKGSMTSFLNNYVEMIDKLDSKALWIIEDAAKKALWNSYTIFNKYSFRRYDHIDELTGKKKILNKSLFIAFTLALCKYDKKFVEEKITDDSKKYMSKFIDLINEDENLSRSISEGSSDKSRLEYVIKKINSFIKKILEV